jgi:hypothetical protein
MIYGSLRAEDSISAFVLFSLVSAGWPPHNDHAVSLVAVSRIHRIQLYFFFCFVKGFNSTLSGMEFVPITPMYTRGPP